MSWHAVDKTISALLLLWAVMLFWGPIIGSWWGRRGAWRGFWAAGLPFLAAALLLACSVRHEQIRKDAQERWDAPQRITPSHPDWGKGKQPFKPCPWRECQ
jgi:MFS family permease